MAEPRLHEPSWDMLDVGLIDRTWLDRLPTELAVRLQELLDQPD